MLGQQKCSWKSLCNLDLKGPDLPLSCPFRCKNLTASSSTCTLPTCTTTFPTYGHHSEQVRGGRTPTFLRMCTRCSRMYLIASAQGPLHFLRRAVPASSRWRPRWCSACRRGRLKTCVFASVQGSLHFLLIDVVRRAPQAACKVTLVLNPRARPNTALALVRLRVILLPLLRIRLLLLLRAALRVMLLRVLPVGRLRHGGPACVRLTHEDTVSSLKDARSQGPRPLSSVQKTTEEKRRKTNHNTPKKNGPRSAR